MAQFRKDVYNLAPGLGQAINDPREDEARAREASSRADRELAMRRTEQALNQALAQRQMTLQEQDSANRAAVAGQQQSFEQSLASAARGSMERSSPGMGRDALMRQANNAAAMEKQFNFSLNSGLDLDRALGSDNNMTAMATRPDGSMRGFTASGGRPSAFSAQGALPMHGLSAQQAGFDRSGNFGDLSSPDFLQQLFERAMADKKLGVEQSEQTSLAQHRAGTLEETRRSNMVQEMLTKLGLATDAANNERALNQETVNMRREVGAQASDFRRQMAPNMASGEIPQSIGLELAQIAKDNPELARSIIDGFSQPEVRRRVGEGAKSIFKPSLSTVAPLFRGTQVLGNLLGFQGTAEQGLRAIDKDIYKALGISVFDETSSERALRALEKTLGAGRVDGALPEAPRSAPEGRQAQEALRRMWEQMAESGR